MMFKKSATLVFLPDKRSWKERQREDLRKRYRRGYKRPDAGKRPKTHSGATEGKRDRRGYKRPDTGKRPKTHSGGNKQRTGMVTNNQRIKREGAFIVKEVEEDVAAQSDQLIVKEDWEVRAKQRKCNSVSGCDRCFCDQCYPPGDAMGR